MKTFKQHLNEVIYTHKTKELVFNPTVNFIPLSSEMIRRIYGLRDFTAFHMLGLHNLKNLKKIERTKKSISTFTSIDDSEELKFGVVGGGGFIAKVKGDLLLKANTDAFTEVDFQGRRWISTSKLSNKIDTELHKYKRSLSLMVFKKDLPIIYQDILSSKIDKKLVSKYIKMYFDGVEIILKKYLDKSSLLDLIIPESRFGYDEIVLNNIKILNIYILKNVVVNSSLYDSYVNTNLVDDDGSDDFIISYVKDESSVDLPYKVVEDHIEMKSIIYSESRG